MALIAWPRASLRRLLGKLEGAIYTAAVGPERLLVARYFLHDARLHQE
jgi:hypothetical protein